LSTHQTIVKILINFLEFVHVHACVFACVDIAVYTYAWGVIYQVY